VTDAQWKRALDLYEAVCSLPQSAAYAQLKGMSEEPAVIREVTEILRVASESGESEERHQRMGYSGAVIGRYDVLELLARGSTGEVYSGRDRELGRRVALKIMTMEGASAGRRFLREAQAVSPLNHPNIVTVHEVMASNSPPVIVMELVEGKSLRALCGQPMTPVQAQQIGLQIMRALAFAHANGIVHRDLKPENIIVRPDGYVKVLDFGLARRNFLDQTSAELSSHAGLPVGTLLYMSPEQCRGEPAATASDVFAAGLLLYEMFAGRHPFKSDSPLDTAHAIAWDQPPPLTRWNQDIPVSIESLILRMLAKDPARRPSAQEAEEELAVRRKNDAPISGKLRIYGIAALVGFLVIGFVWAVWITRAPRHIPPGTGVASSNLTIVPVAGLAGNERMPSFSADGTRVAFEYTSASNPVSHIYLKDLAASSPVALTNDQLPDRQPVFSRDGTRIAFLRGDKDRVRVMVMPATGGIETQVGEVSTTIPRRLITWNPAGTDLIVSDGLSAPEVQIALFAIPLSGGRRRQITFPKAREIDCIPLVSPDGLTLGFARLNPDAIGRIWAMPLADGLASRGEPKLRPLTMADQAVASWSWTPDGQSLLISRMNGTRTSLWRQAADDPAAVRVPGVDDQIAQLSISLAGDRLVYAPTAPGNVSIWLYATAPSRSAPRQLISSDLLDADMRYSPDGRNIAFASLREGEMRVWVCSKDGSNPRKMTLFEDGRGYAAGSPNWSPDGRWIAFDASGAGENSSIYVLDVLGGKPRRLTGPAPVGPGPTDSVPAWSADGRWVYYSSDRGGRHNIWKVPAAGGASVQVTHNTGFECTPSPDGQFLYYTKFGTPGIWRMALSSGEERLLPGLERFTSRAWEGSSRGIYLVEENPAALKFFDFTTQKIRMIRTLPVQPIGTYRGLSVSPDGQTVLYAQREEGRSNVMLVKNFR
jgi:Tol biopolymer transport system component